MKNALTLIIYPRKPIRTRTKKYQGDVNMIVMADDAMVDNSYNNETEIKKTELRKYKYLNEKIGKNIYNLNINLKEIGEPIRVEKIIEDGKIVNKDVQEMFNLSHSSAFDEIKKLLDREVIKSECKGRSTHYVLVT